MKAGRNLAALLCLILFASGCIINRPLFNAIDGGELSGRVSLDWDNGTNFVFLPVDRDPLFYRLPEGFRFSDDDLVNNNPELRMVRPGRMYTDAGSIPRPFWSIPGLSPFDYLPAYVVHDWLYFQFDCFREGKGVFREYDTFPYSRSVADRILYDALEAVDRNRRANGKEIPENSDRAKKLIRRAVEQFGERYWNTGDCRVPPPEFGVDVVVDRVRVPVDRPVVTDVPTARGVPATRRVFVTRTRERRVRKRNYTNIMTISAD